MPNFNSDEAMTKVLAMTGRELRQFITEYIGKDAGFGVANDLNGMAIVEEAFDKDIPSLVSPRYIYSRWVYEVVAITDPGRQPFRATARQRAQAFVLTVMEIRSYEPTHRQNQDQD